MYRRALVLFAALAVVFAVGCNKQSSGSGQSQAAAVENPVGEKTVSIEHCSG